MKKNRLNALLLVLCMCTIYSNQVEAKEEQEKFTLDLNKLFKKTNDLENSIIYNELPIYKQESLWLITDTPNIDPSEERNYYFIDKNNIKIKATIYYDKNGNEVEEIDETAVRSLEQKQYLPITFKDKSFVIRNNYDLENGTITTNFADFDTEYYWEEDIPLEYGRFVDVSKIIPEEKQKEKYSAYDLSEILEIINDPEYEIFIEPMERTIK